MIRGMGWRPDTPDHRDRRYTSKLSAAILPDNVDLSTFFPPNYDQGELGSCTGNGIAGVIQYCRARDRLVPDFIPSRLFIYWNERNMEGTVDSDAGAEIRDGIKSVATLGVPPEDTWPYDIQKFKMKPWDGAYLKAKQDLVKTYARVNQTVDDIRACVADAWPVVFGIVLYESFQSDAVNNTGLVPMPSTTEKVVGGHCMIIVGYDHPRQLFQVRNSWGTSWGDKGNCWIPYDYIVNSDLVDDLWQIDATGPSSV
jgi:C1A family cysteine protease